MRIDREDIDILSSILEKNKVYENRIRAHTLLMLDRDISLDSIKRAYKISSNYVYYISKYYSFFGLNELWDLPYEKIKRDVENEEYRIEQEKLKLLKQNTSCLGVLAKFALAFISFFLFKRTLNYLIATFKAWVTPKLKSNKRVENYAKFESGTSGNVLIQIAQVDVNNLNVNSDEVGEKLVVDSKDEAVEIIKELIKSGKSFDLGNKNANKLFNQAQAINDDKKLSSPDKNYKIHYYAVLIAAILLYGSTFKSGVSSVSIFGITLIIAIRACMPGSGDVKNTLSSDNESPNQEEVMLTDTSNEFNNDTLVTIQEDTLSQIISKPELPLPITDIKEYNLTVPEWFYPDLECMLLSSMGKEQRQFIRDLDYVDHESQDYYIDTYDDKYYIHVVAYSDIREAAFQMHHVNKKTQFKAAILETITSKGILYAVVIGEFEGDEASDMAELIKEWEIKCFSNSVKIGCHYNG